jgi:hypothetical protein
MWIRCIPTLTPSLAHPRTTHRKYKLQHERRPRAAHRRPSPACRAALATPLAVAAAGVGTPRGVCRQWSAESASTLVNTPTSASARTSSAKPAPSLTEPSRRAAAAAAAPPRPWATGPPRRAAPPKASRRAAPPCRAAVPRRRAAPPCRAAVPCRRAAPPCRAAVPCRRAAPPRRRATPLSRATPPRRAAALPSHRTEAVARVAHARRAAIELGDGQHRRTRAALVSPRARTRKPITPITSAPRQKTSVVSRREASGRGREQRRREKARLGRERLRLTLVRDGERGAEVRAARPLASAVSCAHIYAAAPFRSRSSPSRRP